MTVKSYKILEFQYNYLLPTESKKYLFNRGDGNFYIIAEHDEFLYIMSKFKGLSKKDFDNTDQHF